MSQFYAKFKFNFDTNICLRCLRWRWSLFFVFVFWNYAFHIVFNVLFINLEFWLNIYNIELNLNKLILYEFKFKSRYKQVIVYVLCSGAAVTLVIHTLNSM